MAIQIPSAAGFIPNESVMDSIGKIYNLFSKDAKDRRAAELANLKENTRATSNMIDFVRPDASRQGWAQIGTANTNAATNARQVDNQNSQFWGGTLPNWRDQTSNEGRRVDLLEENLTLDQQRLAQQGEQFQKQLDFQKQSADREYGLANDSQLLKWNDLSRMWNEDASRAKLTDAQTQKLNTGLENMVDIYKQEAFMGNKEAADAILYKILENSGAGDVVEMLRKNNAGPGQLRQRLLDRAGNFGASAKAPGVSAPIGNSGITPQAILQGLGIFKAPTPTPQQEADLIGQGIPNPFAPQKQTPTRR